MKTTFVVTGITVTRRPYRVTVEDRAPVSDPLMHLGGGVVEAFHRRPVPGRQQQSLRPRFPQCRLSVADGAVIDLVDQHRPLHLPHPPGPPGRLRRGPPSRPVRQPAGDHVQIGHNTQPGPLVPRDIANIIGAGGHAAARRSSQVPSASSMAAFRVVQSIAAAIFRLRCHSAGISKLTVTVSPVRLVVVLMPGH